MRVRSIYCNDCGRRHIGRLLRGACRSRRCESGLYSEKLGQDLANEFAEVTKKRKRGLKWGLCGPRRWEMCRRGRFEKFTSKARRLRWRMWAGNFTRSITFAYIAEDRWRRARWRGTW